MPASGRQALRASGGTAILLADGLQRALDVARRISDGPGKLRVEDEELGDAIGPDVRRVVTAVRLERAARAQQATHSTYSPTVDGGVAAPEKSRYWTSRSAAVALARSM
jgi:hypothetical protein